MKTYVKTITAAFFIMSFIACAREFRPASDSIVKTSSKSLRLFVENHCEDYDGGFYTGRGWPSDRECTSKSGRACSVGPNGCFHPGGTGTPPAPNPNPQPSASCENYDGGSYSGRGWPSERECVSKSGGACSLGANSCYHPGGTATQPGPNPNPNPNPNPQPAPNCSNYDGSAYSGRGWPSERECVSKSGSNCSLGTNGCFHPGGSTSPGPNPNPNPAPYCLDFDGGSYSGRGWPTIYECLNKSGASNCRRGGNYCFHPAAAGPTPEFPAGPYPSDGSAILDFIENHYTQFLARVNTLDQRKINMAFLRDRIIEVGICAGLDFGYNLKRGGPDLSIDFIAWRSGGSGTGIDIAIDYDNIEEPIKLHWAGGNPNPFYLAYTSRPNCH